MDYLFLVLLAGEVLAWSGDLVYWLGVVAIASGFVSILASQHLVLQVFLTRCPVSSPIFVCITDKVSA